MHISFIVLNFKRNKIFVLYFEDEEVRVDKKIIGIDIFGYLL